MQSGWYLQGVYQFMPRWRVGLRTERLDSGTPDRAVQRGLLGIGGFGRKQTLMLDCNPSEFSRVRLQLARDRARDGVTDNQLLPAVPDEPGRARRARLLNVARSPR